MLLVLSLHIEIDFINVILLISSLSKLKKQEYMLKGVHDAGISAKAFWREANPDHDRRLPSASLSVH